MEALLIVFIVLIFSQAIYGSLVYGNVHDERIVGGKVAPEGRYPFQASLRSYNSHFCGAAILNENWLASAAHCLKYRSVSYMTAVVGTNKLNEGGEVYEVKNFIIHEDYKEFILQNDIGLVQVSAIKFSEKVQPIPLYPGFVSKDVSSTVIGWGALRLGGAKPNDLQYLDVTTISLEVCRNSNLDYPILDSAFCTFAKYGQGACHGDSGGPVVTTGANGEDLLIGLVSWGKPCAVGYPDVHTRVESFSSWIKEKCDNCTIIA